ncbi:hypothetical protein KBB27_04120 [Patescibacteria group bacterium]|nr:hypothetical protein [Patescibacteria group bacterium]
MGPEGLEIVRNASGSQAPSAEQEIQHRCQASAALPLYGAIQRLVTGLADVRTEQTTFQTRLGVTGMPLDASSARLLATEAQALEQLRARSDLFEAETRLRLCQMNPSSTTNAPAPREPSVREEVRVVIPLNNANWLRMPFIRPREPSREAVAAPSTSVSTEPASPCASFQEDFDVRQAQYDAQFPTRATRPLLRMGQLQAALDRVFRACAQELLIDPGSLQTCAAARTQLVNWESAPETSASPEPAPVSPVAPVAPTAPTPPTPPVAREPGAPTDDPPALPAS